MKRFLTTVMALVMLACISDAFAQGRGHRHNHYSGADGLGVSFGYVHSAYRLSDWATDDVNTSDGLDGFNIGLTKDVALLDEALYLQSGLVYTYQNDNRNEKMGALRVIGDWNEHFFSIPLKIKYEVPLMHELSVFVMGGPSIVAGLASRIKYRAQMADENVAIEYNCFSGKIKTNSDLFETVVGNQFHETRYRRADVQLGASAGVRLFDLLEAQIGYDWGLVNKYKGETVDDFIMRRQQFYISVGLRF